MKPITRKEMLMAKAAGQSVPDIEPVTREEIFLAKAAGMDVPELEPITRNEWFISQISGGGGGGGGDSDFSIANVTFVNTYSGIVSLGGPVVFEENEMGEGAPALAYDLFNSIITPNETVTKKIPLYKGSALITFGDTFTCATTGDIEAVGPGMLLVTGGGTITITYVG